MKTQTLGGIFLVLVLVIAASGMGYQYGRWVDTQAHHYVPVGEVSGAGYYFGRWVDTQAHFLPVEEPIFVETISVPELPIYHGDIYQLKYQVTNDNPQKGYNLVSYFSANWEIVKAYNVRVTCESAVVFEKSFTADTIDATEMEVVGTHYYIGPSGICYVEVTVQVRDDAPTVKYYEEAFFWVFMDTYRN